MVARAYRFFSLRVPRAILGIVPCKGASDRLTFRPPKPRSQCIGLPVVALRHCPRWVFDQRPEKSRGSKPHQESLYRYGGMHIGYPSNLHRKAFYKLGEGFMTSLAQSKEQSDGRPGPTFPELLLGFDELLLDVVQSLVYWRSCTLNKSAELEERVSRSGAEKAEPRRWLADLAADMLGIPDLTSFEGRRCP
ncbi:hypothetical protein B296_00012689 [Ensete ventricosum]|uniref:Uncharacterized protein n=1 Tax=Ensete ventricosum TaxID=4639 RepID=A0A427A2D2_ENSVE|nr:hypothetical protein B296_00012689 [Ensete ventricosum]